MDDLFQIRIDRYMPDIARLRIVMPATINLLSIACCRALCYTVFYPTKCRGDGAVADSRLCFVRNGAELRLPFAAAAGSHFSWGSGGCRWSLMKLHELLRLRAGAPLYFLQEVAMTNSSRVSAARSR